MNDKLINEDTNIYIRIIDEEDDSFIKDAISKPKLEAAEDINNRFGLNIKNIICFGNTNEVTNKLLNDIIPEIDYPLAPRAKSKSYKCYCNDNPSIVLHEDTTSSWNCLMLTLNNPKYVLIYVNK